MNKTAFLKLLREPRLMGQDSVSGLTELAQQFPYCSTIQTMLAMNLFLENHVLYDNQLRLAASLMYDRNILRHHIAKMTKLKEQMPLPDEYFVQAETQKLEAGEDTSYYIDIEGVDGLVVDADALAAFLFEGKESEILKQLTPQQEVADAEDTDEQSYENDLKKKSLEDLKRIIAERIQEIKSTEKKADEAEVVKQPDKQALIDKFITENPSISRGTAEFYNPVEFAKQSIVDRENIVSETLAEIYLKQGHIDKAIQVFEKLSLKYPEKSSYFAALIKEAKQK